MEYILAIDVSSIVEFIAKSFADSVPSMAMKRNDPTVLPRDVGSM